MTSPNPSDDYIEQELQRLSDAQDAQDVQLKKYEKRRFENEVNRLVLLYFHAVYAVIIGVLFPIYDALGGFNSVSWRLFDLFPWPVGLWGAILIVSGVVLVPAVRMRNLKLEMMAMYGIVLFYVLMSGNFMYSVVVWMANGFDSAIVPGIYAPFVYLHVATILVIQVFTMKRLRDDQVSEAEIKAGEQDG